MDTKICKHCKIEKNIELFHHAKIKRKNDSVIKVRPRCKSCEHELRMKNRRANPIATAAACRKSKLKRLFGITPEKYDEINEIQNNVCAICSRESPDGRRLHIDHCHKTNVIRGLLCHDCNRGIGMFRDDPKLLQKAAEYVENPVVNLPMN